MLTRTLKHPLAYRFVVCRGFSQKDPVEYDVNEKEVFSEEQMQKAKLSISEKLKAIKAQQELDSADGHVHNPTDFSFVKNAKLTGINSGTYVYNGRLDFSKSEAVPIYQTNRAIYQSAEYVDSIVTFTAAYSGFKLTKYYYILGVFGWSDPSFSIWWTVFWQLAFFQQVRYLMTAYLTQVFMIDEIQLLRDMEHIRISTVLANTRYNLFSHARMAIDKRRSDLQKVYVFPIRDCEVSQDDRPDSPLMRISIGNKKFFLHRTRVNMINNDLIRAVFTKEVERIENMR